MKPTMHSISQHLTFFGSRPRSRTGSRTASRPGSRASSPASRGSSSGPGGHPSSNELDSIKIEGNLYDVLKPRPMPAHVTDILPKEVHVVLRYTVSFTLSKPVYADSIRVAFHETMTVMSDPGDGQFLEPTIESDEIALLNWTIWSGRMFEAGKKYKFEFNGELPPKSPRSLRTPSGKVEHSLTVSFHGVTDSGKLKRTRKTIEVWNPFSMDADEPRPGLEFHTDLEFEMVGTSIDVDKDLQAFLRYPDQCYKGIGRSFPCEISLPTATSSQLHSITHITIDILQIVWFLRPTEHTERPVLLAKDTYPVTATVTVEPSNEPQRASLPLPDPMIHGRFSSDRLRVRHILQVTFHRRWLAKKVEWEGEVEIFHRDLGWETRGVQGVLEIVRGQEGEYWADGNDQHLQNNGQK